MNEKVFCWNCDKSFEIDADEYWETEQEHTFDVKLCPHCDAPNAITWRTHVHFSASEPDEQDKEDFDYVFQDNEIRLEQFKMKSSGGNSE